MSHRVERLEELVAQRDLDRLLVGDLVRPGDSVREMAANLRWLTGFTGTSGLALIGSGERLFFTDFRYVERAELEVGDRFERIRAERQLVPAVAERLSGRVGYDDAATSVRSLRQLEDLCSEEVELAPAGGVVEDLRRVKGEGEVEAISAAAALTDRVYEAIEERGLRGRTERDVASFAERTMRELGAEPAFPVIAAAGPNGALPHPEPSDREIRGGDLMVLDMGALLDGYCSDCTRTLAVGEIDDDVHAVYELVLEAQGTALEAVRAGVPTRDVDGAARRVIADAGHGEEFGHGVGHGVGLDVHEAPRLAQSSDEELRAGDVVTIEPGVYVSGRFGVRIEDLVVVGDEGCRNLSGRPKELRVVE